MRMRVLAALAVLVSGAVHLKLWFDGFRDIDVIGPSFMLNAVAGVVIAALLVLWRHWIPLFLAFGFGATTLVGVRHLGDRRAVRGARVLDGRVGAHRSRVRGGGDPGQPRRPGAGAPVGLTS